mgnify:CR=1 FL=1
MLPESRARMDWQLALNTLLPRDIRIADAVLVPDTFHAQHSAVRKTYEYRLWLSKRYTPPQALSFRLGPAALWMWSVWTRGAATSLASGTSPA